MTHMLDHIEYLTKDIGARPAGTEEEQEAALYITDQFQQDSGFHAEIEEFTTSAGMFSARAICCAVTIVVSILAMIVPILSIPAFILALAAAIIYGLEAFDRPIVSRALARGASQNVVAKYQPNPEVAQSGTRTRTRKIVLVAHYDSGKVTPSIVETVESFGLPLPLICLGAMGVAALLLLIRIFIGSISGVGAIVFNIINIVVLLACALPLVKAVLIQTAPYNEGANNNASGVAALLEAARRISRGSVSEAELAGEVESEGVVVHGEAAAIASGLVPEGAEIRYEAERLLPPEIDPLDDEERLLSAKAAIAAFTGQPVERKVYGSVASKLVNSRADGQTPARYEGYEGYAGYDDEDDGDAESASRQPAEPMQEERSQKAVQEDEPIAAEAAAAAAVSMAASQSLVGNGIESAAASAPAASAPVESTFENAPSWFVSAQQKAKKTTSDSRQIQRSRYTEAIEAAERNAEERERVRREEARAQYEAEMKAREQAAREAILAAQPVNAGAPVEEEQEPQRRESFYPYDEWNSATTVEPIESIDPVQFAGTEEPAEPADFAEGYAPDLYEEYEAEAGNLADQVEYAQPEDETVAQAETFPTETIGEEGQAPVQDGIVEVEPVEPVTPRAFDIPAIEVEDEDVPKRSTRRQLASLPTISSEPEPQENKSPSRSGMFRRLRTDVPSLSGVLRMQAAGEDVSQKPEDIAAAREARLQRQQAEAASTAAASDVDYDMEVDFHLPEVGLAGSASEVPVAADVAQVEEEAVEDAAPETRRSTTKRPTRRSVSNRSSRSTTSRRSTGTTRSGAAADDAVEPDTQSRADKLLGRFRRKSKEDEFEQTPQEWLEVDEDFEARSVGRKRGGWESFRDDDEYSSDFDEDDSPRGSRGWQGGAFSRFRLGRKNAQEEGEEAYEEELLDEGTRKSMPADEPAAEVSEALEAFEELVAEETPVPVQDEIEQIYHFRNPLYNTEVWFVAIGSDDDTHDGAKAFVAEHKDDLRGAMVVELESLAAGDLGYATEEGLFRKVTASSRIKRYTRAASAETGITLGTLKLGNADSIASIVQKAGFQAMHLVGIEDGRIALKGSADDVMENIEEDTFENNIDYIMELLKRN